MIQINDGLSNDIQNRYFLVSVGSSLFSKQNRNSYEYLDRLNFLKRTLLFQLNNAGLLKDPPQEQIKYENLLYEALERTKDNHRLSAELGTLILNENPITPYDKVQFLAVDTVESIIASRVIAKYLRIHYRCTTDIYLVHGLQVDDIDRLESQGFPNLIKHVFNEKERFIVKDRNPSRQMILVVTGAYKPVSNYLTVIGLVMGLPVLYHFEQGKPLFLPGIKLKPDSEPWLENIKLFNLIEQKGTVDIKEVPKYIGRWEKPDLSTFIREDNEKLSLTTFGNLLVHSCKEIYFDSLTGAWAKDFCFEAAYHFCQGSNKVGIAFFDLDHFKKINDNYGHSTGDKVLSVVGARANKLIKKWHLPAALIRYGGEEFLVILPGTDINGASAFLETLRKEMAEKPISTDSGNIKITISIGVSDWKLNSGQSGKDELQAAINRADEALYSAKENGRNQIAKGESIK